MKIYTGESIRKAIPANYAIYDRDGYILAYPAPTTYLIPINPTYAYVCREVLTLKPGAYPGGAYTVKKYRVSAEHSTFPRKYKNMITDAIAH